jgi:hypothetical protein
MGNMTGPELKAIIFGYLESKGWTNHKPTEYYGWDSPNEKGKEHLQTVRHYCWHAALAVQIALDEGAPNPKTPGGVEGRPELVRK